MKKLLRVLVVAALLLAIAIPCLAETTCDHNWVDIAEGTKDATCTKDGVRAMQCTKCEAKTSKTIPATGHDWTDWANVEGKKADCGHDGEEERHCKNCDEKETMTIPATGKHGKAEPANPSWQKKDPTCSEDGWVAETRCSVCKEVLTKKTIPATGNHDYVTKEVEKATCGKDGYSVEVCKNCKKELEGSRKTIPATGEHTNDNIERVEKDATCTENKIVYNQCTVCGEKLNRHEVKKSSLSHNDTVVTVDPTCTEAGSKTYTCARCGRVETKPYGKAREHKKSNGELNVKVEIVSPTCSQEGTETTICKYCNETLKVETLKKLDHTFEWKVTKEAKPCLDGEQTEICKVCGAKGQTGIIKATGKHTFGTEAKVVKEPTCTEEGLKDKVCSVCGTAEGKGEKIPALGHKAGEYTETKAATCTEAGEEVSKCTVCDAIVDTREIAALGHKAGEYTETKAPTCTEKGEEVSKCTVCNAVVDTREVAAKGHTAGEWITVRQPSASQNGKMIQKCTVCGAQIGKKYIRANGSADTAAKTVAYVAGAEVANYAKIDLTVDATTELDLVTANGTKVGKLVVEVKEGKVTVKYELSAVPADAFLTFVAEAPAKDIHAEKEFEFEKAISVADELAGAAAAYIYVEIEY